MNLMCACVYCYEVTDCFVECFRLCAETLRFLNEVIKLLASLQDGFDCIVLTNEKQRHNIMTITNTKSVTFLNVNKTALLG